MPKKFFQHIDTTNRKAMIDFLTHHFRYNTTPFGNASSYANNIKLYTLGLTKEQENTLLAMLYINDPLQEKALEIITDFNIRHNHNWQIAFAGRSDGYLVLYKGEIKHDQIYTYPNDGIDNYETFLTWNDEALRERVRLIQDFDRVCDKIVAEAIYIAENYEIKEVQVITTKRVVTPK